MRRLKTNVEAITDLMEFSKHGAMAQVFIMDSLGKAADKIAAMPIDQLREEFKDSIVSADLWQAVAAEIKQKLDAHYSQHDQPAQAAHAAG